MWWEITILGRKVGAIGIFYEIRIKQYHETKDKEIALSRFWKTNNSYEIYKILSVKELSDEHN